MAAARAAAVAEKPAVTSARNSAGFTLLEVMLAMFILAVGLLALALVQLKTYAVTRETEYRSIVALHAESLAEAMRANPQRIAGQWSWRHYYQAQPGTPTYQCAAASTGEPSPPPCNQAQQARYELYQFKAGLASAFADTAEVAATICPSNDLSQPAQFNDLHCDASGPLAIKVAWRLKRPGAQQRGLGADHSYQLRFSP